MKNRKVILSLDLDTDLPKSVFSKIQLQTLFNDLRPEMGETLKINRVLFQEVKEER